MAVRFPIFYQSWRNLLFLHWNVPAPILQERLPPGLTVDTWNGSAYLGIIPFRMLNLRPTIAFSIPYLSNFTEINLRTYVRDRCNRPGVWFFSLDTKNNLGNWIAQKFFHLNYRSRNTLFSTDSNQMHTCELWLKSPRLEKQVFQWTDASEDFMPSQHPDTLEFFLTERYRLFSYNYAHAQLYSGAIEHKPYRLNRPDLKRFATGLVDDNGFDTLECGQPDSILASSGTDVRVYPLEKVD